MTTIEPQDHRYHRIHHAANRIAPLALGSRCGCEVLERRCAAWAGWDHAQLPSHRPIRDGSGAALHGMAWWNGTAWWFTQLVEAPGDHPPFGIRWLKRLIFELSFQVVETICHPEPTMSYCSVNHRDQNRLASLFVVSFGYHIAWTTLMKFRDTEDVDSWHGRKYLGEVTKEELLIIPLSKLIIVQIGSFCWLRGWLAIVINYHSHKWNQ